jgi:glycerate 2-kinase
VTIPASPNLALRRRLEQAFRASLAAVDPAARVRQALARPQVAAIVARRPLVVAAVGKAAVPMARAVTAMQPDAGLVVTASLGGLAGGRDHPHIGTDAPASPSGGAVHGLPVIVGDHPVPGEASVEAGRALWALAASLPADGVLLALVSGGASALAEVPADGLSLDDLVGAVRALASRGAPIGEVNALRRGLSQLKGGRLALACAAPVVTIAISDVVGDDVDTIGSGPTVGPWTAGEGRAHEPVVDLAGHEAALRARARDLARRHFARGGMPPAAEDHLAAAVPPRGVIRRDSDVVVLAAGLATLRRAAAQAVRAAGLEPIVMQQDLAGDVDECAGRVVNAAERLGRGQVLIAGGEATVALPVQPGWGGRAQHLALLLARRWIGRAERAALIVGSDGVDGPGPNAPAGAFVDGTTWDAMYARGIDPIGAIDRFDAGTALAAAGALVVTGPTGVNHADLVMVAHP